MKKENVYVNLRGKTKEKLTDLWEFLTSNGERVFRDLEWFLEYPNSFNSLYLTNGYWCGGYDYCIVEDKTEVTIEQLKEILQPMGLSLTEQLQKAEAEVKRLQSLIEEENKPKVGDWCYFYDISNVESKVIGKLSARATLYYTGDFNFDQCEKINNPQLIKLLENECSTKN